LIDGLKFDLRIYVLITNCDPLRCFIYKKGLARFATQKYKEPNSLNIDKTYMHLTNYSLNKHSPDFIKNKDKYCDDVGHKRSLTYILKVF